jgi:ribosomal protein bL25 (Ctc-form)
MITVKATRRLLGVRAKALRRRGMIPAVLYGAHLDPIHVALPEPDVRRLFSQITRSTMVELQVDGETYRVFVKDVQIDPITTNFLHLDFYVPEAGRALEIAIPVKIEGEAPGVKAGGVLEVIHPEIRWRRCRRRSRPKSLWTFPNWAWTRQSLCGICPGQRACGPFSPWTTR